jgi:hypothetical protein
MELTLPIHLSIHPSIHPSILPYIHPNPSVQVLPGRTHPMMQMSGGGGFLLTGFVVEL